MSYEQLIADLLCAPDPEAALSQALTDEALEPSLRALLFGVDRDGLRMAALLCARLRYERLVRGSAEAGRWSEDEPAAFAAVFRRYHAAVPPRAFTIRGEAEAFWGYVLTEGAAC